VVGALPVRCFKQTRGQRRRTATIEMTDDRRKQDALGERYGGGFQRGDQVEQAALLFQLRLLRSVGGFQCVRL